MDDFDESDVAQIHHFRSNDWISLIEANMQTAEVQLFVE